MNIYNYDVCLLTTYSVGQRSSSIAGMGTPIYRQGRTKIKIIYTISWRRQNRVAVLKKMRILRVGKYIQALTVYFFYPSLDTHQLPVIK